MSQVHGWAPGGSLADRVASMLSQAGIRSGGELINTRTDPRRPTLVQQYQAGPYRLDFAAPDVRIAIEADESPEDAAKDAERDSWLRSHGWIVLRVDDRHGEDAFADQIGRAVRLIMLERATP